MHSEILTTKISIFSHFAIPLLPYGDSKMAIAGFATYVKNANQAKDILSIIIDNAKQASVPISQLVAKPVEASSSSSVADELAKLAKLKATGILTEEEFQAQKSKLLGM